MFGTADGMRNVNHYCVTLEGYSLLKGTESGPLGGTESGLLYIQSEHTFKTYNHNNIGGLSPPEISGKVPESSGKKKGKNEMMKLKELIGASPESLGKACAQVQMTAPKKSAFRQDAQAGQEAGRSRGRRRSGSSLGPSSV